MAGRPKRVFTDEEKQQIDQMALDNCHFETIAMALEIPVNTLKRHYGRYIRRKRAFGRTELRRNQCELSKSNPAMAIFLGKNELDQTDKQVIEHEGAEIARLDAKQATEAQELAKLRLRRYNTKGA